MDAEGVADVLQRADGGLAASALELAQVAHGLSDLQRQRGEWFVLFPNFCFEVFPDQLDALIVGPRGANGCRETLALYFVGEGATEAGYREARERVARSWHELNLEDIGVVERMHAGRASEGFDGGVLSPYWDPAVQHYARLVVEAITAPDPAPRAR